MAAAWAGLWLLACSLVRAADLVEVRSPEGERKQVLGKIIEETYSSIKVELEEGGTVLQRDIPIEKDGGQLVITVRRGELPPQYSLAYQKFRNRQYGDAYKELGKPEVAQEVTGAPWLAAYVRFFAGESAFREAKYAQSAEEGKKQWYALAEQQYVKLVEESPGHRFAPDGRLGRALALMRLDRFQEAADALAAVAASDFPPWFKAEAEVWQGRLLVEQGRYDEAITKLNELLDRFSKNPPSAVNKLYGDDEARPDPAYLAMLGLGYAYQGKKEFPRAEDTFEAVGLKATDDELRAEAFNSRGLSLLNRGETREALFSFLRVVVLHYDIVHEYQRALYYAAKASREYYGDDRRALELRRTLELKFPNSYWTQKLKQE